MSVSSLTFACFKCTSTPLLAIFRVRLCGMIQTVFIIIIVSKLCLKIRFLYQCNHFCDSGDYFIIWFSKSEYSKQCFIILIYLTNCLNILALLCVYLIHLFLFHNNFIIFLINFYLPFRRALDHYFILSKVEF